MGHLGLTPQFYHALGGFKVQGKGEEAADVFMQQAEALEAAGAFTIVLECIPEGLAQRITDSVSIPTIGIGAGAHVDGQVLVLQDLLGMNPNFKAKLVKKYLDGYALIKGALNQFNCEVKRQEFPQKVHSY